MDLNPASLLIVAFELNADQGGAPAHPLRCLAYVRPADLGERREVAVGVGPSMWVTADAGTGTDTSAILGDDDNYLLTSTCERWQPCPCRRAWTCCLACMKVRLTRGGIGID